MLVTPGLVTTGRRGRNTGIRITTSGISNHLPQAV